MIHDTQQSAQISQKQDDAQDDVDHVSKCMICHKAIAMITGRAHCFHDSTHI